jgi:AraC family transcriptional regulator
MRPPIPPQEYQKRINRAVNFICHNFDRELDLDALASIAGFSPYHFHRLFKAVTGEPVFHFVRRRRLELAATLLLIHRDLPVGQIALDCGFDSQAVFARSFREHFGRSASEWRQGGFWWHNGRRWEWRSQGDASKERVDTDTAPVTGWRGPPFTMLAEAANGKRWECLRKIDVSELPGMRIAYMRKRGPYDPEPIVALYDQFKRWTEERGLLKPETVGIALPQDNQNIVAPEHCRYDVGLLVDLDSEPYDELDVQDIPGGKYLIADFSGKLYEEPLATEYLWQYWMPHHGLEQDFGPVFRRFPRIDWKDHPLSPDSVFSYQICIRVKPLGYQTVKPEVIIEPFKKSA